MDIRVVLYMMAKMLRGWRILCKEQYLLALVTTMEVRAKEPLGIAWRDSATQVRGWVNQGQQGASSTSGVVPQLSVVNTVIDSVESSDVLN
jgi:hypothetical protein